MSAVNANAQRPGSYVDAKKLTQCKRCGCPDLAWWQSNKTNRFYLAHTQVSQSEVHERRYICPWAPHRCETYIARMDALGEQIARDTAHREWWDVLCAHETHETAHPDCSNCAAERGDFHHFQTWLDARAAELFRPWKWAPETP